MAHAAGNVLGRVAVARRAGSDEQRQVVFLGRVRAHCMRCQVPVVRERRGITGEQRGLDPGCELRRVFRVAHMLAQLVEIVGEAAGSDDEHATVAQRCQRGAEPERTDGIEIDWHRYLEHRNVRLREQMAQRHPGTVVQSALRVGMRPELSPTLIEVSLVRHEHWLLTTDGVHGAVDQAALHRAIEAPTAAAAATNAVQSAIAAGTVDNATAVVLFVEMG